MLRYFLIILILALAGLIPGALADGKELYASGDYAGALAAFESDLALAADADKPAILNNIGTCYVALGRPEQAEGAYKQAVSLDPSYGRGFINLGIVQEKSGKLADALKSYESVPRTDPAIFAEAMVKKGTLLSSQQKLSDALIAFRQAESGATGKTVVDLYTGIGAVEFLQEHNDAAEEAFQKAIAAEPDGAALAYTNLGVLLVAEGRLDEAKKSFETAVANDPSGQTNADAYLQKLSTMMKGSG